MNKEYKQQYYLKNKERLNKRTLANYYANKPQLTSIKCRWCERIFTPKRKDAVSCSQGCSANYWRSKNKQAILDYHNEKYHTDLSRKVSLCLRSRLRKALKNNVKSASTISLLGCSIEELKKHLESMFLPGMTWSNWTTNGWHIDHIKPLASFDLSDPVQQKQACNYTNLQPMWAKDNLHKGNR